MNPVDSATREPRSGALQELSEDASSRARFLKMVGGAGAAGALSILIAACGGDDDKDSTSSATTGTETKETAKAAGGDIEIVNYALTLEYLEADFYQQVIDSGEVTDKKIAEIAKSIGENEQEHVDALLATVEKLGGTPATKPKTKFEDVIAGGRR